MNYKAKNWNPNDFMQWYEKGLNDREIGERLNISDRTISSYRRLLKLPSNVLGRKANWTDVQKSVIIGCLLGDGYINAHSPLSGMFVMGHSIEQEAWLKKKVEWLGDMINRKPYYQKQVRKGKENTGVFCYTKSYKDLKELQQVFYKDKIKLIPNNIGELFNELSLAVFYMDDGYCHSTNRGRYTTYYLSTCSFDVVSINNFIQMLFDKWGIVATHQKSNNIIAISSKSKDVFKNLILPYMIPEMMYKLGE